MFLKRTGGACHPQFFFFDPRNFRLFYMRYILLTFIAICFTTIASAIPLSKISGTVSDAKTGERLPGVIIKIEGTSKGAKTNLNGEFNISADPGSYSLRITYLGYKEKIVENAELKSGQTNHVDIVLETEAIQGQEVVVTTKVETETQTAQLLARKSASQMNDFISAEQIKRSPDATSSDALKRVSGVSIVDNKFVEIRGTSERYNNAVLNGAALSSTEPDKKSFSFDLLPANLIDNTIVSKTFTPDLPANFAGGLVQVNTVNFPDKFNARISLTGSYNDATTGKAFTSYQTGKTDWLASDDGTRALPSGFPTGSIGDAKYTPEDIQKFGLLFKNNWKTTSHMAPANIGFALSLGDALQLFDNEFGYIASLSYKSSYDHVDIVRNNYNSDGTASSLRSGTNDGYSVLLGGLLNLTYKAGDNAIISFRNVYDKSADDKVYQLNGVDSANGFLDKETSLHYTERSLWSSQLTGEHLVEDLGKTKIEWRLSRSVTNRSEPDLRQYSYFLPLGVPETTPYFASISVGADPRQGGRFFSDMDEKYNEAALDFTIPVGATKLKFGGLLGDRERNFSARVLAYKIANSSATNMLQGSAIDTLFAADHIGPQALQIEEITNPTDAYDASEHIGSVYGMVDLPFSISDEKFRFIGGARLEHDNQILNSQDLNKSLLHYDKAHDDVLPSLSLVYSMNEKTNIRLAATETVCRPEFREIAPFGFYDFETGSFIQGNDSIDRARIRNLDFRLEYYPTAGELLSVSAFHKRIEGAIEATNQGSNSVKSWANAKEPAVNYGIELEVRKSLRFLGSLFDNFTIGGNYSYIVSHVNVHDLSLGLQEERPMQGQSPYTLNLSLLFSDPVNGTSVTVLYNTYGKRIAEVNPYTGDLYEQPRNVIDLSISQPLFDRYELKYTAKDILAEPQDFLSEGRLERRNQRGSVHSLSFTIKL
jgi:TonB-dependent receptor